MSDRVSQETIEGQRREIERLDRLMLKMEIMIILLGLGWLITFIYAAVK